MDAQRSPACLALLTPGPCLSRGSALFADENLVESEPDSCEEQRSARAARGLLAGDRRTRRERRLEEGATTESTSDFNPAVGAIVKFKDSTDAITGVITYISPCTIESITTSDADPPVTTYSISYVDGGQRHANRAPRCLAGSSAGSRKIPRHDGRCA